MLLQNVPVAGFAVRAIITESMQLAQTAAASALGWVVLRDDVHYGDCAASTATWCNVVPPARQIVYDCTLGSLPMTGVASLALALAPPDDFLTQSLPLFTMFNQLVSPLVVSPTGCAIGTKMLGDGNMTTQAVTNGLVGGVIIAAGEVGILLLFYTTACCVSCYCPDITCATADLRAGLANLCCSLYRGVTRTAASNRRPNDLEELENYAPQPLVRRQPSPQAAPALSAAITPPAQTRPAIERRVINKTDLYPTFQW